MYVDKKREWKKAPEALSSETKLEDLTQFFQLLAYWCT